MSNPFEGSKFPLRPLKDIVFIWPDAMPEKMGSFFIPEFIREKYKDSTGTVVAIGKGCYVPKFKKYLPTTVKVGDRVLFDFQMPFSMEIEAPDGKKYNVLYMGERDLQGLIRG